MGWCLQLNDGDDDDDDYYDDDDAYGDDYDDDDSGGVANHEDDDFPPKSFKCSHYNQGLSKHQIVCFTSIYLRKKLFVAIKELICCICFQKYQMYVNS